MLTLINYIYLIVVFNLSYNVNIITGNLFVFLLIIIVSFRGVRGDFVCNIMIG